MREIKFRAWLNDRPMGLDGFSLSKTGSLNPPVKEMVIEQYTGIKDINGKEIYEGDILNRPKYAPTTHYLIKWLDDGACFVMQMMEPPYYRWPDLKGVGINESEVTAWQVIGNIHENPELVK